MAHVSDRQKAELVRQHQDGLPWTRLAKHSGVAVRTLQRWAARIETGQLARAPRRDKGSTRTAAGLVTAIEALAVRRPAPTIAYIHRRIGDIARDRGLPAPGYTTVREIVRALDPGLTTLADGGDAAYRDRFELVYRRTTPAPNEQWQMDHTLLDVMVVNDRQQPVRPWLTIVLDDYSGAIAGYTVGVSAPTRCRRGQRRRNGGSCNEAASSPHSPVPWRSLRPATGPGPSILLPVPSSFTARWVRCRGRSPLLLLLAATGCSVTGLPP